MVVDNSNVALLVDLGLNNALLVVNASNQPLQLM
jgi:hypothetical protein